MNKALLPSISTQPRESQCQPGPEDTWDGTALSTTDAGTPVFDASGYPHADGEATQLWVDGPAVPPPEGGAGLELVLVAVLDGGVLLLALVLLAAVLLAAVLLDGALVVGRTVLLVGDGLLLGADEVGRTGGRW